MSYTYNYKIKLCSKNILFIDSPYCENSLRSCRILYSVFHLLIDIQVVNDTCFIVIEYIASILYLHQRYYKAVVAIRGLAHQVFAHLYPAIHT